MSPVGQHQVVLGLKTGDDVDQLHRPRTNHHSGELFSAGSDTVGGRTACFQQFRIFYQIPCSLTLECSIKYNSKILSEEIKKRITD